MMRMETSVNADEITEYVELLKKPKDIKAYLDFLEFSMRKISLLENMHKDQM